MFKKLLLIIVILSTLLFLISCNTKTSSTTSQVTSDPIERIYNIDPYRKYIGTQLENYAFTDVITDKPFQLKDFSNKIIIFESFSVGCPACAEGIRNYNQIYDKYGDKVQIIYLNINPADTGQDILNVKQKYNGRDWKWVKFSPEVNNFLLKYDIVGNDITYLLKNGKIIYADSLSAPISRIENALLKAI